MSLLGGGNLVSCPPVFSTDLSKLLVVEDFRIKVFDTISGSSIGSLISNSTSTISCLLSLPNEKILVGHVDGTLAVWDLDATDQKREVCKFERGIVRMVHTAGILAFIELTEDEKGNGKIFQVNLETGHNFCIFKVKHNPFMAGSENFFAYGHGKKVYLWDRKADPNRKNVVSGDIEHGLSGLALLNDDTLIIAMQNGAIQVLRGISKSHQFAKACQTQRSYLHWHSDSVGALAVSSVDGYMATGGLEGVGVLWNVATGKNQFLPRLGGAILHISVNADGSCWALATNNNCIHLVSSADFKVSCKISGLGCANGMTPAFILNHPIDCGLVVLPDSNGLGLQTFNPISDKHAGSLDVVRQNVVNLLPEQQKKLKGLDKTTFHSKVKLAAFTEPRSMTPKKSCWLATVEESDYPERTAEDSLKIWRLDAETGAYQMVALFDEPHGSGQLTDLAFKPSTTDEALELVTIGEDGQFRVWKPTISIVKSANKPQAIRYDWSLIGQQTFYPEIFRKPFASLSVSSDGSLMAIVQESSVLLYDGETKSFLHRLLAGKSSLRKVAFLGDTGGLVAYDNDQVFVWDLESLSLKWSLNVKVCAFTQTGGKFAVACEDAEGGCYALEFGPGKPIPLHVHKHRQMLESLVYVHGSLKEKKAALLVGLTSSRHFVPAFPETFPTIAQQEPSLTTPSPSALAAFMMSTPSIQKPSFGPSPAPIDMASKAHGGIADDILLSKVPSHALPPMRILFASFIKHKLAPVK